MLATFFFGQLSPREGSIWRIITYILIFFVVLAWNTTNFATNNSLYNYSNSHNTQFKHLQEKAQQEAQIQLGGRISELETHLLTCSDAKTLYRKEWGKMHCEKYKTGPRGGYCLNKTVSGDNEILSIPIADSILSLIGPTATVYDFGCGVGQYGKYWKKHSNITWTGFDGAEGIEDKTDNWVKFLDLSEATYMPRRDWSISLEVGEHIPETYQDVFIGNLHRHNTKGIILTWGIPGQGGTNHINLRDNSWVIAKLDALGYDYLEQHSKEARAREKSYFWFKNTYMAFKRREPPPV